MMGAISFYVLFLLIGTGCVLVDVTSSQRARAVTDGFNIARGLLHNKDQLQAYWPPPMVLQAGTSKPVDNLWSALSLSQLSGNVSDGCMNGTVRLLEGLLSGQTWAIQVVDATGKLESGVMDGNFMWLGSFTECQAIQVPYPPQNHTNETQPSGDYFAGMPCTVSVMNTSSAIAETTLTFSLGVCVPSECSTDDVDLLVGPLISLLPDGFEVAATNCYPEEGPALDAPAIAMICLFSCLGALILVGTMYDILVVQGGWGQIRSATIKKKVPAVDYGENLDEDLHDDSPTDILVVNDEGQQSPGKIGRILVSFSIVTNAGKILGTQRSQASLDVIHGIRFISMSWVILGHTYAFAITVITNALDAYTNTVKTWHFQAILNASVSVDSFFLLSGTLLAYLLLKELDRCGGPRKLNWAKFYFHRFWRLTPPYMLILGFDAALVKYMGTGPLWPQDGMDPFCSKNWWTNLLYINNIVRVNEGCFGWAWYLANDMQFFVISPLFVVSLYMNWIAGLVITLVVLLASTITIAVITVQHHYGAGLISMLTNPNMLTWMQNVYFPPWCRIGPYLVGILCGYLIYKTKRKVRMHWTLAMLGWMVAAAAALAVLYGLYGEANGHPLTTPVSAFYSATNRTVWGAALAWVIFACLSGYGGWVNSFLSWQGFMPLSRLTYMAYLVHPIVIIYFLDTLKRTIFYDTLTFIYLFIGNMVLSYGVAFIASLSVEAPMMGLEKVFLK